MVNFEYREHYTVEDLRKLISALRSEGGCPWDRVQTHGSIRRNLIEEAYEAAGAIDEGDPEHLKEELGDVLMQVVFHADIEAAAGRFDLDDVADHVCRKLIGRHPNVFSPEEGKAPPDWDELKRRERHQETAADDMDDVARSLPALWRSEKIVKKAVKSGLCRCGAEETQRAVCGKSRALEMENGGEHTEELLGELLFCAVSAAYAQGLDPEKLLTEETDRFIHAFQKREEQVSQAGGAEPREVTELLSRKQD